MSSLDDESTCEVCGGGEIPSNKKVSTSCAQKVDHCKNDVGASDKVLGNSSAGIDAVSDSFDRVDMSDDDNDDKLFADPPPKEDCQICFQPMPFAHAPRGGNTYGASPMYQPCCGKVMCNGCMITSVNEMSEGNMKDLCLFCRVPMYRSGKEYIKRLENRTDLEDTEAFYHLGSKYWNGNLGLPKDMNIAIELYNHAANLGSCAAHYKLASAYYLGRGVKMDEEKAMYHFKLAAIGGHEEARHFLGGMELDGNIDRSMKHFMIAARSGHDKSLKKVGDGYKAGYVTKDEYASTLRAYQVSFDEMKSEQRTTVEGILVQE